MVKNLEIVSANLIEAFKNAVSFDPLDKLEQKMLEDLPVDYFQFYNSVSSVYSSKIEGEEIDFDSFFKHKFMKVKYQPDYTKKADDLLRAYEFIYDNELNEENIVEAHKILSEHLLPKSQRGLVRRNPMFVINEEDRIEYVACEPDKLAIELGKLYRDLAKLRDQRLEPIESFYFASMIHLVFVKIHLMQGPFSRKGVLLSLFLVYIIPVF